MGNDGPAMRCENCFFWDNSIALRDQSDETGACRRRPPRIHKMTGKAIWPMTEDVDWCGEFSSAARTQEQDR